MSENNGKNEPVPHPGSWEGIDQRSLETRSTGRGDKFGEVREISQPDPLPWAPLAVQRPPLERQQELATELEALLLVGYSEGMEMGDWLASALGSVAERLPHKCESLLRQRPGSWEADLVRQLVNGTIGWPER